MRINYLACVLLLATGCEKTDPLFCQENPGATGCPRPDGDVVVDEDATVIDADPGIDAQVCFGTGAYSLCLLAPPMGQVVLNPGAFDTSGSTLCLPAQPADWAAANQPDSCIVVGSSIIVPNLDVVGSRPLVLLASTTITINGVLDVASHRGGKTGPHSPAPACGSYTDDPADSNNGGGGGAGGSFTTTGGDGGEGNSVGGSGGTAIPNAATAPTTIRAGCPGQKGGDGDSANNGGDPGAGGGAVVLIAGTSIVFSDNSTINASGAGAAKAGDSAGGGGGGAGGMIVFNTPAVTIGTNVNILANGGGGSSGGNDTGGCGCNPGSDPDPTDPTAFAPGGTGGGGNGGRGFGGATAAQIGENNPSGGLGGGGGGGGAGYIQSTIALPNITASPTPVVL